MKRTIQKYLFARPTLFPWLMVLFLLATLFYLSIGVIGIFENSEAMMGFLFLMFTIPAMIILWVADGLLRRVFPQKLMLIWFIEIIITLSFGIWYYYNHFYTTQFVTSRTTPLIVLVMDKEKGEEIKREGFLQFRTQFRIPEDNVLLVKEFLRDNERVKIRAETAAREKYSQAYPMSYMQRDTMHCNNHSCPIQFFLLESDSIPHFVFSEKQFDSMRNVICKKMKP